jgi:outer membrane lipase/esterase
MAIQWLRRALLAAVGASALLLAACGGGTIASQLSPERIIVFGDAFGDVGQNGRAYTVNDGTANVWTLFVAQSYDLPLTPSSRGGLAYATGNARVRLEPDAAGSTATPTVKEQVDAFLAASTPASEDLILISAGTSDVIAEVQAVLTGGQTEAQALANLERAGRDLAAQVRRLVDAGAKHVVVAGPYNLERSPWAEAAARGDLMREASFVFNKELKLGMEPFGAEALFLDVESFFNDLTRMYEDYLVPVCTSVDPGPGIGTGAGELNSNLCTTGTLRTDIEDYTLYVFADRVYPAPFGHRQFGENAYNRIRDRW